MNIYYLYFSDYPKEPLPCKAENKLEAEKIGENYIKKWCLNAKIIKVEEKEMILRNGKHIQT